MRMSVSIGVLLLLFCSGVTAGDNDAGTEIEYLIQAVGNSGCTFVRNGTEHSPQDAASHMHLKYKNGKRWVNSTEQFIDRLATKSSWTSKPYYLLCEGAEPQLSNAWMHDQLTLYRATKITDPKPGPAR